MKLNIQYKSANLFTAVTIYHSQISNFTTF